MIPMIATTMSSSMSVNPLFDRVIMNLFLFLTITDRDVRAQLLYATAVPAKAVDLAGVKPYCRRHFAVS
jgi:hypothetical protein